MDDLHSRVCASAKRNQGTAVDHLWNPEKGMSTDARKMCRITQISAQIGEKTGDEGGKVEHMPL